MLIELDDGYSFGLGLFETILLYSYNQADAVRGLEAFQQQLFFQLRRPFW